MDIDPAMSPDIIGNMVAMGDIGSFDAVYCSHSLEHLYPHMVPVALSEFKRVLKPEGIVYIFVPDLEDVKPTTEKILDSNYGGLCGLDLIYGCSRVLANKPFMAHHCGFVKETLEEALKSAGFSKVQVDRQSNYNLFGVALA